MRLSKYFQDQAALTPGRSPYPIRVTPGQFNDLCAEAANPRVTHLHTSLGAHPVQRITFDTEAKGHNVILAPREDLFAESDRDVGIEMVSLSNSVTSVPDNVACCEVLSVGPLVQNVKVGDLAFIDFFDVKQGYILATDELYIAGCEAFKALYDVEGQTIVPLNNYVVTKRSSDRFAVALNGTDRIEVPRMILTGGIAGGRTSAGDRSTTVLYEEVVSVGKATVRAFPGLMTELERRCLDIVCRNLELYGAEAWMQYDGVDQEEADLFNALRAERLNGRDSDIRVGELAVFCEEVSTKIRIRGEFCHLMPASAVLATIDDEALLDRKIRAGEAGKLGL